MNTLFLYIITFFFFVFFTFPTQTRAEGCAGSYLLENNDSGRVEKETRFEGSEHRAGANDLGYLSFPAGEDGTDFISNYNNEDVRVNYSISQFMFTNANGVELGTYGDIVGLAGDFFGPTNNINYLCSASSPEEGENIFQSFWRQIWYSADPNFVAAIREEFDKELQAIINRPTDQPPYIALGLLGEARWSFLMANQWDLSMMRLLLSNFDHFGSCAHNAYQVVHQIAMNTARAAGDNFRAANFSTLSMDERRSLLRSTRVELIKAYAMNAFGDHYMTDLFSSGHVRTPRKALSQVCSFTFEVPYASAGLAAQWMHDEDNRNGLLVANSLGDVWTIYGDDNYWNDGNADNRYMIRTASQVSRNEIYNAFNGAPDSFQALAMVPDPASLPRFAANNTCPLFIRDPSIDNDVLIRTPVETIRPPAWNDTTGSTACTYTPFLPSNCPSAEARKAKSIFAAFFSEYTALLRSTDQDGWYSKEAPYVADADASSIITSGVSGRYILLTEHIWVVLLTLIFLLNV